MYLGPVGRGVVITAWARRLQERIRDPRTGRRETVAEAIRLQAGRLARAVDDPEATFHPFRWR